MKAIFETPFVGESVQVGEFPTVGVDPVSGRTLIVADHRDVSADAGFILRTDLSLEDLPAHVPAESPRKSGKAAEK